MTQAQINTPSPLAGEAPIHTPSPLAGDVPIHTPSPLAGEVPIHTPSPLAGEGRDGGSPTQCWDGGVHKQRWHVIRSKPRAESTARAQLERQGFRVYFPQLVKPARVRGRWLDRIEPLFPRYLFLALDAHTQSLAPARSTLGVSNIVRFGNEYATVTHEVIEGLMRRADPQTGLHHLEQPVFRCGGKVRILEGPFERLEGLFECYEGEERALILLDLLGCTTRVRVPLDVLIPLPAT